MNDPQIEQWLKSAHLKGLSPEADERIVSALLAAEGTPTRRWWSRGIPLWQAAAACIVVSVMTWLLIGTISSGPSPKQQPPDDTTRIVLSRNHTDEPPPYLTDVSKWKIINITPSN